MCVYGAIGTVRLKYRRTLEDGIHPEERVKEMLRIKDYVRVNSVAEAYELNQKRSACLLGGMLWLKMGSRPVSTAIDMSGLGLDSILENDEEFVIGCMTPLHELEVSRSLNSYTNQAMQESLRHIVGVQFRNCATIGGSIYGRYGFSDVLTMFLALDTDVELYKAGRVPLTDFVNRKKDRDVIVNIILKKTPLVCKYLSQRNTDTDFPVLTCAASLLGDEARTVVGARPGRAMLVKDEEHILMGFSNMPKGQREEAIAAFAQYAAAHVPVEGNMRAGAEYRTHLVKILTGRAWKALGGMKDED